MKQNQKSIRKNDRQNTVKNVSRKTLLTEQLKRVLNSIFIFKCKNAMRNDIRINPPN